MTRLELLHLVIGRARTNGFELRRWYTGRLGLPWISYEAALNLLDSQRRYYALIFSHEFAEHFWKAGSDITFDVPAQSFQRTMPDGSVRTVQRKSFIRRSSRPHAWRYHMREMTVSEDPLRYLRRYLHIEEDIDDREALGAASQADAGGGAEDLPPPKLKLPEGRPLPIGLPEFLRRPYNPAGPAPGKATTKPVLEH